MRSSLTVDLSSSVAVATRGGGSRLPRERASESPSRDDGLTDGYQNYAIVFQAAISNDMDYSGRTPPNVSLVNIDDETAGFIVSATSGDTTESGGMATFSVELTRQPSAAVTLTFDTSNAAEGIPDVTSLVFTDMLPQVVTVTGQDDALADGSQSYRIDFDHGCIFVIVARFILTHKRHDHIR